MRPEVAAACEFLGLDPLNVANEGKLVAIVAPEAAERLLAAMQRASAGARGRDHRPRGGGRAMFRRDAHLLRRRTHRRLAGGRAIAADLLRRARRASLLDFPIVTCSGLRAKQGFTTPSLRAQRSNPARRDARVEIASGPARDRLDCFAARAITMPHSREYEL